MKAKKHIITTQDIDLVITDVTLLSIEEYEANKDSIPPIFECWWLRSPGSDSSNVANVYDDGYVNDDNVDYDNNVRPVVALRLPESGISNLNVGDKIEMAGHTWTILRDGLALCDDVVGRAAFRKDWKAKDANVYEVSDIKKWLERWAFENGINVANQTITVEFNYGALCDPYEEQANAQGFTLGDKAKLLQDLGHHIAMLWMYGLLTDSQYDEALKKLQKRLVKALKPIGANRDD